MESWAGLAEQRRVEFGDFQTPPDLASRVCALLARQGMRPASVVEPTCGAGHFLLAAREAFPGAAAILGLEINAGHLATLRTALRHAGAGPPVRLRRADFFTADWQALLDPLPEPILMLGNPPWVTSAAQTARGGANLPRKSNFQGRRGLDAVTGKSNFDISEWMLIRLLESLAGRRAVLAMLCKTAVARRVLAHAWQRGPAPAEAALHRIDAGAHFGASVEAGLLVCRLPTPSEDATLDCPVHETLEAARPRSVLGWRDGALVADVGALERLGFLRARQAEGIPTAGGPSAAGEGSSGTGLARRRQSRTRPGGNAAALRAAARSTGSPPRWRSGVKHDCAGVMEFRREGGLLRNGLGEAPSIEDDCLYPMLKSSDLAGGRPALDRWMLVPQRAAGGDPAALRRTAPRTWRYLTGHAALLDARRSAIHRRRPRFSVFGVGDYTFAPWKVAVSGFYKTPRFRVVGPREGRPVVLDDTAYFLPAESRAGAQRLAALLNSDPAQEFFAAFLFADAKRPVTIELLERLDLVALAGAAGRS